MSKRINISILITSIISIVLLYISFIIGDAESYLFPRFISAGIATLTILLWFENTNNVGKSSNFKVLLPGLAIALAYILSLKILGFYLSSAIVFFVLTMVYKKPKEYTNFWHAWLAKLGIAIAFTLTLYLLFTQMLQVHMPKGIFF